jgi:hypothetical protein
MRTVKALVCLGLTFGFFAPAHGAVQLTSIGSSSFGLISDGTSSTIQLGENARATLCFQNVTLPPGITDGTSNTIQFTETVGLEIIPGGLSAWGALVSQIHDGTSNTIFLPEVGSSQICLRNTQIEDPVEITDGTSNTIEFGENTRFDFCFNNASVAINDGTSNTITFPEKVCYQDVQIADNFSWSAAPVSEPASLALLLAGLIGLHAGRGRLRERA